MNNLSIIIPTYNEEGSIERLLEQLDASLTSHGILYEVIIVDDHSSDRTREIVASISDRYPVRLFLKQGAAGKAFSLKQGFDLANYDVLAMIDADLQYPPEAIAQMLTMLDSADIVVANRKVYKTNFLRKFVSFGFRALFGRFIFGLLVDIQSGLKVFKREVWKDLQYVPSAAWTFDLEFLYKAKGLGFRIASHDITFAGRERGESKVDIFKTIWEIGTNAVRTRLKRVHPHQIVPEDSSTIVGAGIRYKKKKYVTHTLLPHSLSALITFHWGQKLFFAAVGLLIAIGIVFNFLNTLLIVIAVLSLIYFIDVLFNLFVVWQSLNYRQEISSTSEELAAIDSRSLPVYSILCPLYKEAHVIPQFVDAISKLDWPKHKLEVMLLLEEDDAETIAVAGQMKLPSYVRIVVVSDSQPKTKPKACNYGLWVAKGEYLVIFDAEDIPDPLQLKKAYLAFQKGGRDTVCLQAKLNYYNPHHNLLTRLFTAEYSLWFNVSLTGLQSLDTSLPLGGTSNHFKVENLKKLQGWDPFNVTEDADLGIRLFRQGYKTAIIDSTTLEEANSRVKNWIRQRSRWIKGYMQTYLVHTRQASFGANPIHALYFHLTIGGKIAFILINPILWLATISYFTLNAYVGGTIEYLFPGFVFYIAGISLVFGNFLFVYYYMIGAIEKRQWALVKYIFLVPVYWLLISIAGYMALYQLLFKPHYWEKTVHGFHLKIVGGSGAVVPVGAKKVERIGKAGEDLRISPEVDEGWNGAPAVENFVVDSSSSPVATQISPSPSLIKRGNLFGESFVKRVPELFASKRYYLSGGVLVAALFGGNVLNFLFNAYLGRELGYETFGLVSLINSFFYFASIPLAALGMTVSNRTGFLEKRYGKDTAFSFLNGLRKWLLFFSFAASIVWILCIPLLMSYFNIHDIYLLLLFTPIWLTGFSAAVNKGYLEGRVMFVSTAVLYVVEPLVKLYSAVFLVEQNRPEFVYIAIPLSVLAGFVVSRIFVVWSSPKAAVEHSRVGGLGLKFPMKFFFVSLLSGLSMMTFLSIDVILAKHYLPAYEAGQYALVSLVGKIIYFLSTLFTIFIIPFVSRNEGASKDARHILWKSLAVCLILATVSFVGIGLLGSFTVPILFGEKTLSILQYLPAFALAVACFSLSSVFVSYYLARRVYSFAFATFFLALVQIFLINILHASVHQIVTVMLFVGCANLYSVIVLHLFVDTVGVIESNVKDFFGIFGASMGPIDPERKLRILIFNWRDTRHRWAGGAEVYIQEIAKRWVKDGNSVTIFCGNDGHSPRYQVINGVQIVRRGGFFTVYLWAFLYYILKFRGKFDIVVDSENGIPFLTPLFVRKPVFLLIHHVHQEVFRKHLPFVLSLIASVIEGKIMPMLYKNNTVITVSESSRKEIERLGFLQTRDIHVVHPGIESGLFSKTPKTQSPTVIYLGRIKPYKNLDVLIRAFANVVSFEPTARLLIAGEGESKNSIVKLVSALGLADQVIFTGKVSDAEKIQLLGSSWVAVQPSQVEGWGITVIEANACGTPVIASYVNGLKDSIVDGKTGILVPPGNVERFSEAILSVITYSKLRMSLSYEAYTWSQNFSWDKSAKEFYEIIVHSRNSGIGYRAAGGLAWHNVEEVQL